MSPESQSKKLRKVQKVSGENHIKKGRFSVSLQQNYNLSEFVRAKVHVHLKDLPSRIFF